MSKKQWWVPLTPDMLGDVILRYPKLNEPDTRGKFADNKFKTDVVPTDPEALKRFKAWATKVAQEKGEDVEGGIKLPIKKDKKDKEAAPFITLKTKRRPIIVDAKRNTIPVAPTDKNGKPIAHVRIRGGSLARVAGQLSNYEGGLYLMLDAVQIIELAGGSQGADAFAAVEGGYEAEEGTIVEETTSDDTPATDEAPKNGDQFDL